MPYVPVAYTAHNTFFPTWCSVCVSHNQLFVDGNLESMHNLLAFHNSTTSPMSAQLCHNQFFVDGDLESMHNLLAFHNSTTSPTSAQLVMTEVVRMAINEPLSQTSMSPGESKLRKHKSASGISRS
jgi:hypothetical protein